MKLEQPFKGYFPISQGFGLNFNNWYKGEGTLGHGGIDFACPSDTPVLAPCNGTVIYVSTDLQKGEGVSIMTDDIFQWNGQDCKFSCIHWHMKDNSIVVKVGDKVKTGDLLGLSDNTGQSTGPHLHFGIAPLSADGARRELAPNNGYKGFIDPLPYLNLSDSPNTAKIKELQQLLNKYGANLVVDGKFGILSTRALNNFLGK